jgi:hypothetical protein
MQKRRMLLLLLLVLLIHPVQAQPPTPLPTPTESLSPLPTYGALVQIQSRNEAAILARPGVRGIGIGRQGLLALVFHIYAAPGTANLPTQIEGVPVKVIPVGPIKALTGLMGTSTSNGNSCLFGTLGLRVVDGNNPGHAGYITNNHVATIGTNQCLNTASIGTPQYSPDKCNNGTEIGKLSRFIPISLAPNVFNRVDAAFVENSGAGPDERTDCGLCFPPRTPITPLNALGTTVRKCGSKTHLTSGTVITINFTVSVGYDNCGVGAFNQQIVVQSTSGLFSDHGDSGSAVYGTNGIVGLLFAGDSVARITVVNPIADVFSQLNVTPGNGISCTSSGNDSSFGGGGGTDAPRIYPAPNGEVLVAVSGGTLLKFQNAGGSGHNLFAIELSNGTYSGLSCYNYFVGSQKFPAAIRDVKFAGGFTIVALADGRIVKINGTGGTGQNMFAINTASGGFTGVSGYSYYVGSHKFSSGIASVDPVGGELLVSLDDGRMLKVTGTGGGGLNLFAIQDNGSSFSGLSGYNYYRGDQSLGSAITAVASISGSLFVATANGKVLKVNGTGGGGHNMFAISSTSSGYSGLSGYHYYVGDQKFSSAVKRFFPVSSQTLISLSDGRILKITGTGGGGHNMFAVNDLGSSFTGVSGYPYYVGDQKTSGWASGMASVNGQLVVGFSNGKMLKVTGTGGGGHNMFAVQETGNGFTTVSGYNYLVGSSSFGSPVSDLAFFGGFTWVGIGNNKLLKVNGGGGSGLNMYAVAQTQTDFSGLCGYNYFSGSQSFN